MEPSAHKRFGDKECIVIVCPRRLIKDGSPSWVSQVTSLADVVPPSGGDALALISQSESAILLFVGEEPDVGPEAGLVGDHSPKPGQPLIVVVDDLRSRLASGLLASVVRGYIVRFREDPI